MENRSVSANPGIYWPVVPDEHVQYLIVGQPDRGFGDKILLRCENTFVLILVLHNTLILNSCLIKSLKVMYSWQGYVLNILDICCFQTNIFHTTVAFRRRKK